MDIQVFSPAFKGGGMIPSKYTCDGENISPALQWQGVPPAARSIAIISDDPDAPMGTWVHWVLFNLPAETEQLSEKIAAEATLANGAKHGTNDFRKLGYGGPCPPNGTHRYFFKVYCLDIVLNEPAGITKRQLLDAMHGHVLANGQLMGKYKRQ